VQNINAKLRIKGNGMHKKQVGFGKDGWGLFLRKIPR